VGRFSRLGKISNPPVGLQKEDVTGNNPARSMKSFPASRKHYRNDRSILPVAWIFSSFLAATLMIVSCISSPSQPRGDFPAYSSLNSALDGTLALYESLAKTPAIDVDRDYAPPKILHLNETRLILGVDVFSWVQRGESTLADYERLVGDGGRLVIGFLPVRSIQGVPWGRHWLTSWNIELTLGALDSWGALRDLRSCVRLSSRGSWMPIIPHGALAEAAEKSFGKGTIVLMTDTFSLSNAAMREASQASIPSVVIGNSTEVTFDEYRFGLNEAPASLRRDHP
jgi:hypothetical protein